MPPGPLLDPVVRSDDAGSPGFLTTDSLKNRVRTSSVGTATMVQYREGTNYEEEGPSPGRQFPGDLEITREHAERVLALWASRQFVARLRHARDGKPDPPPGSTTCAWLQAGRELSWRSERAEPVGRSVAASPVESFGLKLKPARSSVSQILSGRRCRSPAS